MRLYQLSDDPYCHRVRLVLAEKDLAVELVECDGSDPRAVATLAAMNPRCTVPTIVDAKLVLYDSRAIVEYVDNRYPAPPLMPIDPGMRAQLSLVLNEIEHDWYDIAGFLMRPTEGLSEKDRKDLERRKDIARAELMKLLEACEPALTAMPYLFSPAYSLVDATAIPILSRLSQLGLVVDNQDTALARYIARMTTRRGYQWSLPKARPVVEIAR